MFYQENVNAESLLMLSFFMYRSWKVGNIMPHQTDDLLEICFDW